MPFFIFHIVAIIRIYLFTGKNLKCNEISSQKINSILRIYFSVILRNAVPLCGISGSIKIFTNFL